VKVESPEVFVEGIEPQPVPEDVPLQSPSSTEESTEGQRPNKVQGVGNARVVEPVESTEGARSTPVARAQALESMGFQLEPIETDVSVDYNQVKFADPLKDDYFKDIKFADVTLSRLRHTKRCCRKYPMQRARGYNRMMIKPPDAMKTEQQLPRLEKRICGIRDFMTRLGEMQYAIYVQRYYALARCNMRSMSTVNDFMTRLIISSLFAFPHFGWVTLLINESF